MKGVSQPVHHLGHNKLEGGHHAPCLKRRHLFVGGDGVRAQEDVRDQTHDETKNERDEPDDDSS